MAAVKTKSSATVDEPLNVASNNPDEMVEGGLADDFDGTVTRARYVPWDYNGTIDHHVLGVALTIQPNEGKEFTQTYSAGDLSDFQPSMDGRSAVDLASENTDDHEGIYAIRVGKKPGLNNNSNWAQFLGALIDANFDKANITPSVEFMEGTYAHWNRIAQKKRSGITVNRGDDKKQKRDPEILVITELKTADEGKKAAPKVGAKASASAAPATSTNGKAAAPKPTAKPAAKAQAADTGESLDDRIAAVVTEAVLGSDEGLAKSKLAGIMVKAFEGAEKAKAIKRVQEMEFLEGSETWTFDADTATLFSNA